MDAPFASRILAPALFAEDFDLPPARHARAPFAPEPLAPLEAPEPGDEAGPYDVAGAFDAPEPREAPEPMAPPATFTADDLAAARADGFAEGEAAGRQGAEADAAADTRAALSAMAHHLGAAAEAARAEADRAAEAIAQMVLAGLAAAFPRLSARFGPAEVESLVQRILPALQTEPRATIHLAPAALDAVRLVLADLDADRRERIRLVPDERLAPGDVRISWEAGEATRDGARLWEEIEAILAPAGLMPATPASSSFPPPPTQPNPFGMPRMKEPAHGH